MGGAETKILPPHITQGDIDALLGACHDRPFDVLGVHRVGRGAWCVAMAPGAIRVDAKIGARPFRWNGSLALCLPPKCPNRSSRTL